MNPLEMIVVDMKQCTVVCSARIFLDGKPHLRVERPSCRHNADHATPILDFIGAQKLLISEVVFDKSRGTIDLEFDSYALSLQSTGRLKRSFKFESSIGPMTWNHDHAFGKGLQLLDARNRRFAKLESTEVVPGTVTSVHILAGKDAPRMWVEEILASSLAVLEWKRKIGRIGGLGPMDVTRMTKRLVASIAGFPGATSRFLEGKTRRKTERETGIQTRVVKEDKTGRVLGTEPSVEKEERKVEEESGRETGGGVTEREI